VEDFDKGGEGVGYADTTSENSGGEYRSTAVDIEACDEGGFNVGWAYPDEWLKYTVNVAQSGTYTLEFRVASLGAGGTFHIEVNGVDRTGPITIPDTSAWQNWTTVTRSGVNLSAGSQAWRLVLDDAGEAGAVGNFNYIRVSGPATSGASSSSSSTPYSGAAAALPGTVQFEDYDRGGEGVAYHDLTNGNEGGEYRSSAVDMESTTDEGGGYNVGYALAGEWLNYTVNVASAGTYDIEVRVASRGSGGTFHVEVNGVNRTGSFTVPDTGGWQDWVTIRKTGLSLNAGQQVWRVVLDSNGDMGAVGNFNYFRIVTRSGGGTTPPPTTPSGWSNQDIGSPARAGSTTVAGGTFTVSGGGEDIFGQSDEFQFVYQQLQGDVEVIARVASLNGPHSWSKAGVMIRAGLAASDAHAFMFGSLEGGWAFQRRRAGGDDTDHSYGPDGGAPGWVRLTRSGSTVRAYHSTNGTSWTLVGTDTIELSNTVYVGLALTSHDANELATAVFSDVVARPLSSTGNQPPTASNQPPTASISSPADGATYTSPASMTIHAVASDGDGTITRVDFYASGTPIGSDTSSPYNFNWAGVAPGTYSLTALARDDDGALATSAPVTIMVTDPDGGETPTATTLLFTPSPDHETLVTSYSVAIYRSGSPASGTPAASMSLGRPSPSNDEIYASISDIVDPLPAGSYYAVVTAVGPGGSAQSSPSESFTK
jgi:Carbohydrate binding module (family 6)/Bacterial Ig domain